MASKSEPPGCLLALFKLFGTSASSKQEPVGLPYRRKDYLLTKAERAFFDVLTSALGNEYRVFAKVRLADLLWMPRGTQNRRSHFNRIKAKHVDFLLCDRSTIRPLLAIELDDSTHQRQDRQSRDGFLDRALANADLPLLRVPARSRCKAQERILKNLWCRLPACVPQGGRQDACTTKEVFQRPQELKAQIRACRDQSRPLTNGWAVTGDARG